MTIAAAHVDQAIAYARAVADGETAACEWVRRAAARFLADVEREDWPWRFDPARAERACRFAELLPHVKGEWALRRERIRLEPWQAFIIANLFGFVDADGYRRFAEAYIEVPRKNAKSTLASIIGHYMLTMDGEIGAEVYSAATTRDQARITFDTGRVMADWSPEYTERYGVNVGQHAISIPAKNATWKPLSRESSSNEGLSVHCGILDELHVHKTRDMYGVLRQGMGARRQPLLLMITTAGSDVAGVCYEQRTVITQILDGTTQLDRVFGVIYTIDEGDDPFDPETWAKANPNLGVSVYQADMEAAAAKAATEGSGELNEFLTKRLNVWVTSSAPFFHVDAWRDCRGDDLYDAAPYIPREFDGSNAFVGIDFATRRDIAAMVILLPYGNDGFAAFGRYYLPEDAVRQSHTAAYASWVHDRWITPTPGNTTDYAFIARDLLEWNSRFQLIEVAYDPRDARQFATAMDNEHGLTMVELTQGYHTYNEPMRDLEARIFDQRIAHNGDPVMTWAMGNVIGRYGALGDVMPGRENDESKIDPVVALLMALARAIVHGPIDDSWLFEIVQ